MNSPSSTVVSDALAAVSQIQIEVDALQQSLADRTAELGNAVREFASELQSAGQVVDPDLIRRLYWDSPSLATTVVYEAFGLRSPNDVSAIAGRREFSLPCRDCSTVLIHEIRNRTQLTQVRIHNRCEECAARLAERERLAATERDRERERWSAEMGDAIGRAMRAYVQADPDHPDEPPGQSLYVDIPVPEWGSSTVRLRHLNAMRLELADGASGDQHAE